MAQVTRTVAHLSFLLSLPGCPHNQDSLGLACKPARCTPYGHSLSPLTTHQGDLPTQVPAAEPFRGEGTCDITWLESLSSQMVNELKPPAHAQLRGAAPLEGRPPLLRLH